MNDFLDELSNIFAVIFCVSFALAVWWIVRLFL
jgi:hypothetical protein